jgi:8-oxo-dGTP diphosphatase
MRQRVAAVILRDEKVLMVRERALTATGRHDGVEYWTLPGGGVEPGESLEEALRREVAEEVGLTCTSWRHLLDFPYPTGQTACFRVEVAPGEPVLGVDEDLPCDCPRMLGLQWMPVPPDVVGADGVPVGLFYVAVG